jgi:uncharacterized RDD family membrane protein YckC
MSEPFEPSQRTPASKTPGTSRPGEPFPPAPRTDTRGTPGGPSGPRAGFWRRFGAAFIDGLIIGVPIAILALIAANDAISFLWIAVGLAYFTYFEGSESGQTVGKRAVGIRVIDFSSGGSIGYGRAALRWVGRLISSIPCYLGYLWMLWDKEKQTWHDKIANDVVVPTDAYPVERWP